MDIEYMEYGAAENRQQWGEGQHQPVNIIQQDNRTFRQRINACYRLVVDIVGHNRRSASTIGLIYRSRGNCSSSTPRHTSWMVAQSTFRQHEGDLKKIACKKSQFCENKSKKVNLASCVFSFKFQFLLC